MIVRSCCNRPEDNSSDFLLRKFFFGGGGGLVKNQSLWQIAKDGFTKTLLSLFFQGFLSGKWILWEDAKVSHKRVFALLTPEIRSKKMAQMLQKPVFALPGCQRMSVNTLLCDTLGPADFTTTG